MTPTQRAYQALQTTLGHFMPVGQRMMLLSQLKGEEGVGIAEIVNKVTDAIATMASTHQTASQGDQATAPLHYFSGAVEAWITEKDMGNPTAGDVSQRQAFGLITLSGDVETAELGYISLEELIGCDVELDLYWTPKTLAEIRKP
ncbi:hypothetical protein [Duganella sp. FT27W]|uniref:hypothetical protein n=1 Tax=Duganella sp. FT27W TaxID=2654636 RepID=UPI00128C9F57|nr:hypothetical protein [Duganella sp. FT27W]MPQ56251.1 hypothetical protein [Duganella sp. FT27W]